MTSCQKNNHLKLEVKNITKAYSEIPVLNDISLHLKDKEFVSLIGPSGSGKSTLFSIISGLEKPDSGQVIIDGVDFTGKTGRISYMHQKDLLLPWMKVIDNVTLPLVMKGESKKEARELVGGYFKTFGLEGFEQKYPFQLSGGMRQRAALMRTYMFTRDIILLDEPFGGLDAITKSAMQQWLLGVIKDIKASVLLITHDIEEAILLADRIYVFGERPATIREEVQVELPAVRSKEIVTTPEFNAIKKHILAIL